MRLGSKLFSFFWLLGAILQVSVNGSPPEDNSNLNKERQDPQGNSNPQTPHESSNPQTPHESSNPQTPHESSNPGMVRRNSDGLEFEESSNPEMVRRHSYGQGPQENSDAHPPQDNSSDQLHTQLNSQEQQSGSATGQQAQKDSGGITSVPSVTQDNAAAGRALASHPSDSSTSNQANLGETNEINRRQSYSEVNEHGASNGNRLSDNSNNPPQHSQQDESPRGPKQDATIVKTPRTLEEALTIPRGNKETQNSNEHLEEGSGALNLLTIGILSGIGLIVLICAVLLFRYYCNHKRFPSWLCCCSHRHRTVHRPAEEVNRAHTHTIQGPHYNQRQTNNDAEPRASSPTSSVGPSHHSHHSQNRASQSEINLSVDEHSAHHLHSHHKAIP